MTGRWAAEIIDGAAAQRMRALAREAVELDGEMWYPARAVCAALGLDMRKALRKIRPENRRRQIVYVKRYYSYPCAMLNRAGVEAAILIAGGHSRRRLMDALDGREA